MKTKKFEEGTNGVSSKPKKMNLFQKLKAKEDASADMAASIDAGDSKLEIKEQPLKPTQSRVSNVGESGFKNEESLVGPTQPKAESLSTIDFKPKVKIADNADMKRVAAWQAKRGLAVDGKWGKDTQAAYDKEQSAKKSTTKKMPIGKNYSKLDVPEVKLNDGSTGKRDALGNTYYKNDRVVQKDSRGKLTPQTVDAVNKYEKSPVREGAKITTSVTKPKETKKMELPKVEETSKKESTAYKIGKGASLENKNLLNKTMDYPTVKGKPTSTTKTSPSGIKYYDEKGTTKEKSKKQGKMVTSKSGIKYYTEK